LRSKKKFSTGCNRGPLRLQPALMLVERSANSESIQKTSEVGALFCRATAG
jgi:hypothetical protein